MAFLSIIESNENLRWLQAENPYFPEQLCVHENFIVEGKYKRMASNPIGVKKSPGAHQKDRKKRTGSQTTFMAPQH